MKTSAPIARNAAEANARLYDVNDALSRLVVHAKAPLQPLRLSEASVAKLIEAREAVRAAQRLIEKEIRSETLAASVDRAKKELGL